MDNDIDLVGPETIEHLSDTEELEEEGVPGFNVKWFQNVPETDDGIDLDGEGLPHYHKFSFTAENIGPTSLPTTPYEAFKLFLTEDIARYCVTTINDCIRSQNTVKERPASQQVKVIDYDEIMVFIAVLLLIEMHGKAQYTANWETDPVTRTPIFGETMGRNRSQEIMSHHTIIKFLSLAMV